MRIWLWALVSLLSATSAHAAVLVTWNANTEPDLAGYKIQYAYTCESTWSDLATTKNPSFLDTAHNDGAYRILAFDNTGHSSTTSSCYFVASVIPPPPPAIVTKVNPTATGAYVTWTGIASGLQYASDNTKGFVDVTSVLPKQGTYMHTRAWARTQSWVCYRVQDAATGTWTEQGCNNFSSIVWEPSPTDPAEPELLPSPPVPTPDVFAVTEQGNVVTLTYNAIDCPRGISRSTTGNKVRTLTLTCLK